MLERNGPEKKSDYYIYVDETKSDRYKLTVNALAKMNLEIHGYSYQDPVFESRNLHDAFNYRMRGLSNWNEAKEELAIKAMNEADISKKFWKVFGLGKVGPLQMSGNFDDRTPSNVIFYQEDDSDNDKTSNKVREKIDEAEKKSIEDILKETLKGADSKETVTMEPTAYSMLVEKEFEKLDQEVTAFGDFVKKTRKSISDSRERALKENDPDILKSLVSVIEAMFGLAQTTFLNEMAEDAKRRLERIKENQESESR